MQCSECTIYIYKDGFSDVGICRFCQTFVHRFIELLLKRTVCPRIIKLLLYMYVNQKCYVKWANELSEPFTVANGVKQGAVISPLLLSIYIDNLFKEFK